jgi:hypothetical protein
MGSRGSLIVATHVGPMFRETNDKAHKVVSAQCKKASRDKWQSQHLVKCIVRWDVAPVLPETSLYLRQATPGQNPRRMLRKPETSYRLFWRASYFICGENELKTTSYSTMERDNSEAQHDDRNKIVPKYDRQCTHYVTMRCLRVSTVTAGKQWVSILPQLPYMQIAIYCHLWLLWLYSIFHIISYTAQFEKKCIKHKMCFDFFFFFYNFAGKFSHSKHISAR